MEFVLWTRVATLERENELMAEEIERQNEVIEIIGRRSSPVCLCAVARRRPSRRVLPRPLQPGSPQPPSPVLQPGSPLVPLHGILPPR